MNKDYFFGVDEQIALQYAETLNAHVRFVKEAGDRLGIHPLQLVGHDKSKFTADEFPGYAMHFKGGGDPDRFSKAWLHHIHANPHHWQHWIFPDGYSLPGSQIENSILPMPGIYAKEMIADWMGASMAYTGSWDMADWLWKNIPKIRVHSTTAKFLREELDHLGYADVVYVQQFASESAP